MLGVAITLLFSTQMALAAPAEQTAGTGTVTIVTGSDPAGTTGFFYFGQLGSFTQDDGQSQTFSNVTPGTYDVYQSVQAGWVLDISCVGGSNAPLNNGATIPAQRAGRYPSTEEVLSTLGVVDHTSVTGSPPSRCGSSTLSWRPWLLTITAFAQSRIGAQER